MNNSKDIWVRIVESITAPLGFFVLALLIVESFLASVLIFAGLEKAEKMIGIYIGAGLFILVTVAVAILDWFKATNLVYDKEAHLRERGRPPFGTSTGIVENRDELLSKEPDRGEIK